MVKTGDNMILKEMITGNNDRLNLKERYTKHTWRKHAQRHTHDCSNILLSHGTARRATTRHGYRHTHY